MFIWQNLSLVIEFGELPATVGYILALMTKKTIRTLQFTDIFRQVFLFNNQFPESDGQRLILMS